MATPGGVPPLQPGQQPTPAQIAAMQKQLAEDAAKNGMTVPEFIAHIKKMQAQASSQQQQQQSQQQNQPQPITPGPPTPVALAVAKFLKSQDLKMRTCILDGARKDMFKVKRALRALQSPAYTKARSKNPVLPEITDRASLENTFKTLPMSMLALRVSKIDPNAGHEGHNHAPPAKTKRVKGLWTVKIEPQQECKEELHYAWLYEGPQWKQKLYAVGALVALFTIVLFPLWPLVMRQGVWYLSMGMLGLIGLFFAMSIFRLILWLVTVAISKPAGGLWLYPNLFADVGFFDSFRPVWGVGDCKEEKPKKKKKKAKSAVPTFSAGQPPQASASTTSAVQMATSNGPRKTAQPVQVEEVDDD